VKLNSSVKLGSRTAPTGPNRKRNQNLTTVRVKGT
jgi:hypothetical protein